jgi:hypothetical protein
MDILATFIQQKERQIDYVVELGSGIGINLFFLAYKLDPSLRRRIRFFSCEVTDSGRTTCEKLLGFIDELKMSAEYFGIDTEMANLYGKNPLNPSSIISWHKITD